MNSPTFKALVRLAAVGVALLQTAQGALEWTLHSIPRDGTNDFAWGWSAAFGNGKFVAIDSSGQTYSAPGREPERWTRGERIRDVDLSTIIFGAGKFVAVGLDEETTN